MLRFVQIQPSRIIADARRDELVQRVARQPRRIVVACVAKVLRRERDAPRVWVGAVAVVDATGAAKRCTRPRAPRT